jgi:lipopolysaccharide assembly protein A
MAYVTAALRAILFLLLFLFALKNHEFATLKFYFDLEWKAPLVLLLLIFFGFGVVAGLLACLPRMFRQRREVQVLTSELKNFQVQSATAQAPRDAPRDAAGPKV